MHRDGHTFRYDFARDAFVCWCGAVVTGTDLRLRDAMTTERGRFDQDAYDRELYDRELGGLRQSGELARSPSAPASVDPGVRSGRELLTI